MKIAIISDIHSNLLALQAVLADVARQGVDQTVNLGDILSGPSQARVAESNQRPDWAQALATGSCVGQFNEMLLKK